MKNTIKGFATGFIAAALLSTTTFAAPVMKNINIAYENIKIYLDGILLKPVDVNGYGVVIADIGSDMYVTGVPDSRWDDEILSTLGKVSADNFEAVFTGNAVLY